MRLFKLILLIVVSAYSNAQTTSENFVKSTNYKVPTSTGDVSVSEKNEIITYYDGLGRTLQSTSSYAGGEGENIYTHFEYDEFNRTIKSYLPYADDGLSNGSLDYKNEAELRNNILDFYNTHKYENTSNPYTQTLFEHSPLNRPISQGAPGESWNLNNQIGGHPIRYIYTTNFEQEVVKFDVNYDGDNWENPNITSLGYYGEGQLKKSIVKDENWMFNSGSNHTTETFTDKKGQTVLKRTYENNVAHDTYYVYDPFGNLTYVLSPRGTELILSGSTLSPSYASILNKYCYAYKYDKRNRLIEKKIPGKDVEFIFYDKLDRPRLTQDALQRENNEYLFTKYDELNRPIYTGKFTTTISKENILAALENEIHISEHSRDSPIPIGGDPVFYENKVFPVTNISVLTINYYDRYVSLDGITMPNSVYNTSLTSNVKGLNTVVKTKVLGENQWITTVNGYDDKGQLIYNALKNNYLNSNETISFKLDFTGKTLESIKHHNKGGFEQVIVKDFFEYDHQNRPLTHKKQINDEPLQLISSNTYDNLGQLESKKVGGETTFDGFTDIVNTEVDLANNIIKNISGNSWNARIKTKGVIRGDGGLSFKAHHDSGKYYKVGIINTQSSNTNPAYFDYGIYIISSGGANNVRLIDHTTSYSSFPSSVHYDAGDKFTIERVNATIYFKKNNVTFHTITDNNVINYTGKAYLYTSQAQIDEFTLFGENVNNSLQTIDYKYNIRGWLTDINNVDTPAAKQEDLFSFRINYNGPVLGTAAGANKAVPLYNGNISQISWRSEGHDKQKRGYGFKYDALNRLRVSYSRRSDGLSTTDAYGMWTVYDKNGNITSMNRNGFYNDTTKAMDRLTYNYDGNQLIKVNDNASSAISDDGFYDGFNSTTISDYVYDLNGNMISDKNKSIDLINYNHLNLPNEVQIDGIDANGVDQDGTITYVYDASGVKQAKIVVDNNSGSTNTTSYVSDFIYKSNNGNEVLEIILQPEGYIEYVENNSIKSTTKFNKETKQLFTTGYRYAYQYKDHLGNIRLTYADTDGNGSINPSSEILSEKNYYPFGLQHKGYNNTITSNSNSTAERFGYNGKENNPELGLEFMDFGARNYDAAIGRWMNIDPLAEQMRRHSPYNYAFDNPVYFIDPDGMSPTDPNIGGPVRDFSKLSAFLDTVTLPSAATEEPKQDNPTTETEVAEDDGKSDVSELNVSDKGVEFIKSFEGFEPELYNDAAGHATIGYGHLLHKGNITDADKKKYPNGISIEDATTLLKSDIEDVAESAIDSQVTVELTQSEFDATASFIFNVGGGNFKSSTLKKKINSGKATSAEITKEFNKWNKAGGKVLNGLTKRRKAEAKIYTTGVYDNNK